MPRKSSARKKSSYPQGFDGDGFANEGDGESSSEEPDSEEYRESSSASDEDDEEYQARRTSPRSRTKASRTPRKPVKRANTTKRRKDSATTSEDEEGEEEEEPEPPRKRAASTSRRTNMRSVSSDDDCNHSSFSDDEPPKRRPSKRKRPPPKSKRQPNRRRQSGDPSSEEDAETSGYENDDSSTNPKKGCGRPNNNRNRKSNRADDDEEEEEDYEEPTQKSRPATRKRGRKRACASSSEEPSSAPEEDEEKSASDAAEDLPQRRRNTTKRGSTLEVARSRSKARREGSVKQIDSDSHEEYGDDSEEEMQDNSSANGSKESAEPPRRLSKMKREEEEAFDPRGSDASPDEEGEDVWTDENGDSGEEEESEDEYGRVVGRVGDVDDIGVAEDSDDEENRKTPARTPTRKSHPGSVSSGSDEERDSEEIRPSPKNQRKIPASSPKLPRCPSEFDAITMEPLPHPHVCFFPPDGERQCFSLETLRKIALTAGRPSYRSDHLSQEVEHQTYLQPPHFRFAMSDELLDQIASRFGREALDLHGIFHKRSGVAERPKTEDSSDDDERESSSPHDFMERYSEFFKMMQEYLSRRMGSQDLYVCPVCYRVAHRRATGQVINTTGKSEGASEDRLSQIYPNKYMIDPMQILGSLDGGDLRIASTFCFLRIPALKQHLRVDHGLDTSIVDGNDLFKQYKIRATDGLLQTYLNSGQRVYRRSMQSYWFKGNNAEFVCLLGLVTEAQEARSLGGYASDDEQGQKLARDSKEYFESFNGIVDGLWNLTVDPFRKDGQDLVDFINDDTSEEEVEEEDEAGQALREEARNVHRTLLKAEEVDDHEADLELARNLEERYRDEQNESDDYEEEEQVSEGGALVDSDEETDAEYEKDSEVEEPSSSSSEDDFSKKIREKRGMIGRRKVTTKIGRGRARRKRTRIQDSDSE